MGQIDYLLHDYILPRIKDYHQQYFEREQFQISLGHRYHSVVGSPCRFSQSASNSFKLPGITYILPLIPL